MSGPQIRSRNFFLFGELAPACVRQLFSRWFYEPGEAFFLQVCRFGKITVRRRPRRRVRPLKNRVRRNRILTAVYMTCGCFLKSF